MQPVKILYVRENVCCKESSIELERATSHLLKPSFPFFVVVNNPFVAIEQLRLHHFDVIVTQYAFHETELTFNTFIQMVKSIVETMPNVLLLCSHGQQSDGISYKCIEEEANGQRFLRKLCEGIKERNSSLITDKERADPPQSEPARKIISDGSLSPVRDDYFSDDMCATPIASKRKFYDVIDSADIAREKMSRRKLSTPVLDAPFTDILLNSMEKYGNWWQEGSTCISHSFSTDSLDETGHSCSSCSR